jgi:hypothetical protein
MRPTSTFSNRILILMPLWILFLCGGCKSDKVDPESPKTYYWSLDEKIEVEIHPRVVTLRDARVLNQKEIAELLGIEEEMITSATRAHNELWRIDLNKNHLQLSQHTIPALSLNGSVILMTGEITLMPSSTTNLNELIQKYNLTLVQQPNYGVYLFLAPNPSQTLSLANTIQEKENVKWASPNFISPYVTLN